MESDLVAVLQTVCARVHPDLAPLATTVRPFITWQLVGGRALRHIDNSASAQRMSVVMVKVWSLTRAESLTLARAAEEALCAATQFNARPDAELVTEVDEDLALYGTMQDFTILADR